MVLDEGAGGEGMRLVYQNEKQGIKVWETDVAEVMERFELNDPKYEAIADCIVAFNLKVGDKVHLIQVGETFFVLPIIIKNIVYVSEDDENPHEYYFPEIHTDTITMDTFLWI